VIAGATFRLDMRLDGATSAAPLSGASFVLNTSSVTQE
jgi:hypothetical protein